MPIDISESSKKLSEIDVVSSLADNDMLVLERGTESYNISYSTFKHYFFDEMTKLLNIGSIASCDQSEYAKFAHYHDYTDLWFFPSYGPNAAKSVEPIESCYMTGKFNITKYYPGYDKKSHNTISVYIPNGNDTLDNQLTSYSSYSIGDIKLIDTGKMPLSTYLSVVYGAKLTPDNLNVDIHSDKFDGFVVPNGFTFECSQSEFKDACKYFSANKQNTATSFTVPVLNSFFKLNPGLRSTNPLTLPRKKIHGTRSK